MQYFSRAAKSLVLREGPPTYAETASLVPETDSARVALYSFDGSVFAYSDSEVTRILNAETREAVRELPISAADMYFSPKGSYLVTWNRSKLDREKNEWTPNLKVWNTQTGDLEAAFVQKNQGSFRGGWDVQFTSDEQFCVQKTGPRTLVVTDAKINSATKKVRIGSLSVPGPIEDFVVSPGMNPSVSVFVGPQNGKPAFVRVYKLPSLSHPVAQRTLFRAESVRMLWNSLGTALAVVAQSDVDASNKSYYGETSLHLLNVNSGSDQRIMLDREGPVYDVDWSPDGNEFAAVYGLMPSKTSFFDVRGNEICSMPLLPRNHLKYSPQGNFIVVAGFGNLQGNMDVYDRTRADLVKVGEILATNSSFYDWSPCGRFLLTATTSPRLRVDNGVKIWDYRGRLMYQHDDVELFAVGFRPQRVAQPNLAEVFTPHESAKNKPVAMPSSKPKGAYLPPHARKSGAQRNVRSLYDATQPGAAAPQAGSGSANANANTNTNNGARQGKKIVGTQSELIQDEQNQKMKQIRSLVKKLRAIDELKNRDMAGEKLEVTQLKKIETEKDVREKLHALGWTSDEE